MALLIRGQTTCAVCDLVVEEGDEVVSLPHFVRDRTSELFPFSDASMHADCVVSNEEAACAVSLAQQIAERLGPGNRRCEVCAEEIGDPDDYFTFGYLTDRNSSSAFAMNWRQFHRSHLRLWNELNAAIAALEELVSNEGWFAGDVDPLLRELRAHAG